jgi:hypothetical protein
MAHKTRVVNKYKEQYDVYIGRGSIWGNPYSHLDSSKAKWKVSSREEAIQKYKDYILNEIEVGNISIKDLKDLVGKRLGCFCKPKDCHGDFLVILCNELEKLSKRR